MRSENLFSSDLPELKDARRDSRAFEDINEQLANLLEKSGLPNNSEMEAYSSDSPDMKRKAIQHAKASADFYDDMIGKRFTWTVEINSTSYGRIDTKEYYVAYSSAGYDGTPMGIKYYFNYEGNDKIIDEFASKKFVTITGVMARRDALVHCEIILK